MGFMFLVVLFDNPSIFVEPVDGGQGGLGQGKDFHIKDLKITS